MSDTQYLLVRADDLVVLGLGLDGFSGPDASGVVTADAGARLTLVFPPQAVGEQKLESFPHAVAAQTRLSGPSTVVLAVPDGTAMGLTVTDVLKVAATCIPAPGTVVEIPWKLLIAPVGYEGLGLAHTVAANAGTPDAHAVWMTRFVSPAPMGLQPMGSQPDDPTLDPQAPLSGAQRDLIPLRATAAGTLPLLARLELSALGGSLTAHADWGDLRWDHETVLGRDQRVSFVQTGAMYPTGHRAQYAEYAERRINADADGNPVATFHVEKVLTIIEPIRRFPAGDSYRARAFPFDEVEILVTTYAGLTVADAWDDQWKPPLSYLDQFQQRVQALIDESNELDSLLRTELSEAQQAAQDAPTQNPAVTQAQADLASATAGAAELNTALNQWYIDCENADRAGEPRPPRPDGDTNVAAQIVADAARALADAQAEPWYPTPYPHSYDELTSGNALRWVQIRDVDLPAAKTAAEEAKKSLNRSFQPVRTVDSVAEPVVFPIRGRNPAGDVDLSMPMRFVADLPPVVVDGVTYTPLTDTTLPGDQRKRPGGSGVVVLPGVTLDLVRSDTRSAADLHEVHQVLIGAAVDGSGQLLPQLVAAQVALPSLKTLLPTVPPLADVRFHEPYLTDGESAAVLLELTPHLIPELHPQSVLPADLPQELVADFTQNADRSGGLVSPRFVIDALSRDHGPVNLGALPGGTEVPDLATLFQGAKLLGIDLVSLLLPAAIAPPLIQQVTDALGRPPTVTMDWESVPLTSHGPFVAQPDTHLTMHAVVGVDGASTDATLTAFTLRLPEASPLISVKINSIHFSRAPGAAPHLDIDVGDVAFLGDLGLLEDLQNKLDLGTAAKLVQKTPNGVRAGYSQAVPTADCGFFSLRNISLNAAVDVPFDGAPVTLTLGFASRQSPFQVSVLTYGGGGYVEIELDASGLRRFEASLDFGASLSMNLGVASGEVHALGGVRYLQRAGNIACTGFVRIGGSVNVLDLVSISIELVVELTYADQTLSGRATLVIEVDLTIWSDSIELDSGTLTFAGGGAGGGAAPQSLGRPTGPPPAAGTTTDRNAWASWWEGFAQ